MRTLTPPYRLVSLDDGEELTIMPASFEEGEAINPHGILEPGARVPMLRVYLVGLTAAYPRQYWDFTSRRLIVQLPLLLDEFAGTGARIRIQADGWPPRTVYTVSVEPA